MHLEAHTPIILPIDEGHDDMDDEHGGEDSEDSSDDSSDCDDSDSEDGSGGDEGGQTVAGNDKDNDDGIESNRRLRRVNPAGHGDERRRRKR